MTVGESAGPPKSGSGPSASAKPAPATAAPAAAGPGAAGPTTPRNAAARSATALPRRRRPRGTTQDGAGQAPESRQTQTGVLASRPGPDSSAGSDSPAGAADNTPASRPGAGSPPWETEKSPAEKPLAAKSPAEKPLAEKSRAAKSRPGLSARLSALARLIQIGTSRTDAGLSPELLADAEQLLDRAGERLRLSDEHTVVAFAGGTGSGKSSLFNKLAGASLSAVGVTRPVTRYPHACVWGAAGSGPLLEWLGVPRRFRYTRGSALDRGEQSLNGLVLLDLPDHDSVATGTSSKVAELVGMADLMVWVLDPQKYADAAVHQRYLVPLAGHSDVIAVVLNQSDLLSPEQIEECAGDLRRLLDSEGLQDAQVLITSAETGDGVDRLAAMLGQAVSERRATGARISADLDGIAEEFKPYAALKEAAGALPGQADVGVPASEVVDLEDAFARAAGVSAVVDALASARELRAVDYVGWPIAWLAERLTGRNPVRKIRLGKLWEEVRGIAAGPSGAQQAEIDTALTKFADAVGKSLPKPWSQTSRSAVRSRAGEIPGALGSAMGKSLPSENAVVPWWRLVGAVQGLLLGCVIVCLAWIGALVTFGVRHTQSRVPRLFSDASLLPWVIAAIAVLLVGGCLIAWVCDNLVEKAAQRERQRLQEAMRASVDVVAREMAILPAEQELAEYRRFRDELTIALGS
jgi:GTP-binding protein EngB required for normal cell division